MPFVDNDQDELDISVMKPPIICKKSDTLVSLHLDHESPFLRTTSNTDIFNTLLDYKAPASCHDWNLHLGRDSEMEMNSHSYATLAAVEESGSGSTSAALGLKDTSESSGCWPFVFDQGSQKDLFHTSSSSDVMVDPSQLQSSSLMSELNNNDSSVFSQAPDNNNHSTILDAINALGTSTFSKSFVEKVTDHESIPQPNYAAHHHAHLQMHQHHQMPSSHYEAPQSQYFEEQQHVSQPVGFNGFMEGEQYPQNLYWQHDPAAVAAAHHQYWLAAAAAQSPQHNHALLSPQPFGSVDMPPANGGKPKAARKRPSRPKKEKKNTDENFSMGLDDIFGNAGTSASGSVPLIGTSSGTASDNAGNRRRSSQHTICCTQCDTQIGIVFIRGSYNAAIQQPANIVCKECSQPEQVAIEPAHVDDDEYVEAGEAKKRKRADEQVVDCEVCRGCIGVGGISSECLVDGGEIKSEFVCADCGDKYMFCSECGGGGKQRTGKWRPKELFENGRRTCSLPHIRVGTAEVHYKVIPIKDLTTEILQGIQDVFFDCLISLYCVPNVMMTSKFGTFDAIKAEIEQLWLNSVLDVLTHKVLMGQKYITVAWIQKRHRNKGVGKPNAMKDSVPWLQKLGLSGIISGATRTGNEDEDNQCFVAFSIAEWDVASQSIFLAQMAPRSVFLKTMDGYVDLIKNCVAAIHNQANESQIAKPTHIWCWAKPDHARLQSIPIRLKFMPREDYLGINPKLAAESLDRPDYEPLQAEGTVIYASSVKPFVPKH